MMNFKYLKQWRVCFQWTWNLLQHKQLLRAKLFALWMWSVKDFVLTIFFPLINILLALIKFLNHSAMFNNSFIQYDACYGLAHSISLRDMASNVTSLMTGIFEVPGKRGIPEYSSARIHPRDHRSISVLKGSPNKT